MLSLFKTVLHVQDFNIEIKASIRLPNSESNIESITTTRDTLAYYLMYLVHKVSETHAICNLTKRHSLNYT